MTTRKILLLTALLSACIVSQAQDGTAGKVWDDVAVGWSNSPVIKVTHVAMFADRTEVSLHVDYPPHMWIRMNANTVLVADGRQYAVKQATGITLGEHYYMPESGKTDFLLTFEPLPSGTEIFDMEEPGGWVLHGIHSTSYQPEGLTDTYWRSEATGEWLIGFAREAVVCGCKLYDIVGQTEKNGVYVLKVVDKTTGERLQISVGREKHGLRNITIGGGKPVKCSMITSATLPDYPTKDLRKGFKDTGFQMADSVTFIGWYKDMHGQMWRDGREFEITYTNIFSGEQENVFAPIDSLGRFSLKIPLLNSSEVFIDWHRIQMWSMLEPGETYFFLYDGKTGQRLFMGSDCRLQNELLAYPRAWLTQRISHSERGKADVMDFKIKVDSVKHAAVNELETRLQEHPNLSARYGDYVEGDYDTSQGESLMQALYAVPEWRLPEPSMNFVTDSLWTKARRPYTLYRDFSTFMDDYLEQIRMTRERHDGNMTLNVVRKLEQEGKLSVTEAEWNTLREYARLEDEIQSNLQKAQGSEEVQAVVNAFNANDTVAEATAFIQRNIGLLEQELYTKELRNTADVAESVSDDRQLRDIYLTRYLLNYIDGTRQPLPKTYLKYAEEEIKIPSAVEQIRQLNDKYIAIQHRDISTSKSLKPADGVAEMTSGEAILRKILEPYRGHVILIDVWGTWCAPCKEALSHSKEVYQRLAPYDMVYLYLANRSEDASWRQVIKEYDLTGDNIAHYNLPIDQQTAIEHFLKVTGFPSYRLVDAEGNILDVNADPSDLEGLARLVEQLTGKTAE